MTFHDRRNHVHSSDEPGELSQRPCHDDSTINTGTVINLGRCNPSPDPFTFETENWHSIKSCPGNVHTILFFSQCLVSFWVRSPDKNGHTCGQTRKTRILAYQDGQITISGIRTYDLHIIPVLWCCQLVCWKIHPKIHLWRLRRKNRQIHREKMWAS